LDDQGSELASPTSWRGPHGPARSLLARRSKKVRYLLHPADHSAMNNGSEVFIFKNTHTHTHTHPHFPGDVV
jgi:hypothetical protein